MKYLTTCLLLLIVFNSVSVAQKVKSEYDKFTKQSRITTKPVVLKSRIGGYFGVYLRSVDTTIFIILLGSGSGADVIGTDDRAIFLLQGDSTVSAYSTGLQTYEIGKNSNSFRHQYKISLDDIQALMNSPVKSIRKYGSDSYVDIDIPEKNQDEMQDLCSAFLKEFNKK